VREGNNYHLGVVFSQPILTRLQGCARCWDIVTLLLVFNFDSLGGMGKKNIQFFVTIEESVAQQDTYPFHTTLMLRRGK
jgi:hypothetical protein